MTPSPQPESPEPLKVVAARVRAKLQKEADRRNFAYDVYGMDNTPQTVDADLFALLEMIRLSDAEAAIQAARNEAEAMRAKAARYDWLSSKAYTEGRDGGTNGFWRLPFVDGWGREYSSMREYHHATLDSAIDAAMKGDAHADQA